MPDFLVLQKNGCPWVQSEKSPTTIPILEYSPIRKKPVSIYNTNFTNFTNFYVILFLIFFGLIILEFLIF